MSHLLVYEPHATGHPAEYLLWIVRAWSERARSGRLTLVAAPHVLTQRPDLDAAICADARVRFVPTETPTAPTSALRNAVGVRRGDALRDALAAHRPDCALLMNLDYLVAPLAARLAVPARTRLAGLTLRPVLHYSSIGSPPQTPRERLVRWVKGAFVRQALRHPALDTLFSLDAAAVPALRALGTGVRVEAVPDPVPPEPVRTSREAVHEGYGVEAGRRLAVLPGLLDPRKGALVLPEALLRLPADVAARTTVLMAGAIYPGIDAEVRALCARVAAETPVQMILRDTFVPTSDLQSVVAAADLVVLPYNRHVGSSGFQLRAAAAGVPALTQAWGLTGHLARQHCLGPTADTTSPEALARTLARAIDAPAGFDPAAARAWAAGHTVEAFAEALLSPLLGSET